MGGGRWGEGRSGSPGRKHRITLHMTRQAHWAFYGVSFEVRVGSGCLGAPLSYVDTVKVNTHTQGGT